MSFLSTIVKDAEKGFEWLTSTKGQAVIAATETGIEIAFPPTTAFFALLNLWGGEVVKVEAIAAATGTQSGTGAQKAAVVISTMTPQVIAWATANGYAIPNAAEITAINNSVVTVLNLLGQPKTTPTPAMTPAVATTTAVDGGKAI